MADLDAPPIPPRRSRQSLLAPPSIHARRGTAAVSITTPKAFSFAGSAMSPLKSAALDDLVAGLASPSVNEPLEIDILPSTSGVAIARRPSRRSTHNPRSKAVVDLSLAIPETNEWPQVRPVRTPISKQTLSLLPNGHSDPNHPPSLIGSASSGLAMESPKTPSQASEDLWTGMVHLPANALAVLDILPSNVLPSLPPLTIPSDEMRQIPTEITPHSSQPLSPQSEQAFSSLNTLDIPSPDEFFGTLPSASRIAWNAPSTSTAENFYHVPWLQEDAPAVPKIPERFLADEPSPVAEIDQLRNEEHHLRMDTWLSQQYDLLEPELVASPAEEPLPIIPARTSSSSATNRNKDSTHYHAFQTTLCSTGDAFVQSSARLHALRTARKVLPAQHRSQLAADLSIAVKQPKQLETEDQQKQYKTMREQAAAETIAPLTWSVNAHQYLNNGLLISPVQQRLTMAQPCQKESTNRMRVLDLGGASIADWGWHCAAQFPNVKVYTLSTHDTQATFDAKTIRGPRNHRQVYTEHLHQLPFPNNHFDVISTRSLHTMAKSIKAYGNFRDLDEYDLCLAECLRCLKPGGYLEFSLFDAEITNAASLGAAKCAEFSFSLKAKGYDPNPTRVWLGKVAEAGFADVKRSWMFVSAGPSDEKGVSTESVNAVSGLAGSWAWEQWYMRLHLESGKTLNDPSLDILDAVLEESRNAGAGWRYLKGYARKQPLPKTVMFL